MSCQENWKKLKHYRVSKNSAVGGQEKFAMGNDLSKQICKGIFHLQGWNDDQSANPRNFSLSLFMS